MRISDWSSDVCSSDLTERDDNELNNHIDEIAIHNSNFGYPIGFISGLHDILQFSEVDPPCKVTVGGHNHEIDQGGKDLAERNAVDQPDFKVYHTTAMCDFLSFFHIYHKQQCKLFIT